MKHGQIYIGTSGWHYRHWIGTFYPKETKLTEQFNLYKQTFKTVEINNSFYRLPSPEIFKRWRDETPDDFLFAVKASRYITHQKKLTDPKESTRKFFTNVKFLKEKLGPILFSTTPRHGKSTKSGSRLSWSRCLRNFIMCLNSEIAHGTLMKY